jgi:hypothetical protein
MEIIYTSYMLIRFPYLYVICNSLHVLILQGAQYNADVSW